MACSFQNDTIWCQVGKVIIHIRSHLINNSIGSLLLLRLWCFLLYCRSGWFILAFVALSSLPLGFAIGLFCASGN